MSFHELVSERYSVVAADSGLKYFRVDPLPSNAKKLLFVPQDEVIQRRYEERGKPLDPELVDPKRKGMVLYSLGDYNKGPQRFFVVQMDDRGMWWIRPMTTQTNWSSTVSQNLQHTNFQPWHKELIMHPKLMTVEQFHKIKKVSDLAPEQEHDTDTAKKIVAGLKQAGYKPSLGKKQLHEIPILIGGKTFKNELGKELHLQVLLREDKTSLSGNLQYSYAKYMDGRPVQKGDESWLSGREFIEFKDFDSGMSQLLAQIKKYEK